MDCCWLLLSAWALHYLPFFLMGRQLFIHHYFPALYVSVLILGATFDLFTARLSTRVRLAFAAVFLAAAAHVFVST